MKRSKQLAAIVLVAMAIVGCTGIVGLADVPSVVEAGVDGAVDATRDVSPPGHDAGRDASFMGHDATGATHETGAADVTGDRGTGDAITSVETGVPDASSDASADGASGCALGQIACSGSCVLATDPSNCGGCGIACPASQTCTASTGTASCGGECGPGQSGCSGTGSVPSTPTNSSWSCTAGEWTVQFSCGSSSTCAGAICTGSCAAGQTRCNPSLASVDVCGATGTWVASTTCDDQTCVEVSDAGMILPDAGASAGATPQCAGACAPAQTQCTSATQVETCTASGTWSSAKTCGAACECPSGEAPPCLAGYCGGTCTPGAKQCSGTQVQLCGETGGWDAPTACASGVCMEGPPVACGGCTPGTTQCVGVSNATQQVCQSNGTWNPGSVVAGACNAKCTPNTAQPCNGPYPQTCSAVGQEVQGTVTPPQCGASCVPNATTTCNSGDCNQSTITCTSAGNYPDCPPAVVAGGACNVGNGVGACKSAGTYVCSGAGLACSGPANIPTSAFQTSAAPNGSWDWNCDGISEQYYPTAGYNTTPNDGYNETNLFVCGNQGNQGACTEHWGCPGDMYAETPPAGVSEFQACATYGGDNTGYAWYWFNTDSPTGACGDPVQELSCYWSTNSSACKGNGVEGQFSGSAHSEPMPCR